MTHHLPSFRTYDVRGMVPEELDAELAGKVARAVAGWSGAEEVVVGRDARLSSPDLAEAVIEGLLDSGVSVLDVGLVTTPMLNYAVARLGRHGLMVTASHNPKQYNGIKVIDPGVEQVYYGRGLEALEARVVAGDFPKGRTRGTLKLRSIREDYEAHLYERFREAALGALAVAIDCSNGVGSLPLGVLESLGLQPVLLHHVPNGAFPHHESDTLQPQNLRDLQQAVRDRRTDVGIMFDGDSDRVAFVDERGDIAPLDLVFVLLARQALEQRRGRVFYDLRFSRVVPEEIERRGGIPVALRVGNPFHKEALHRHADSLLAAELSGHIMYREHFGIDDPLYAALKLLVWLARSNESLSRQLLELRRYAGSGELRLEAPDPQALLARVKAHFGDGRVAELDGVTVDYSDWWFNLRPSHTEPVVKLVIEAGSADALDQRQKEVLAFIEQAR